MRADLTELSFADAPAGSLLRAQAGVEKQQRDS
jgi:hypothetical protein